MFSKLAIIFLMIFSNQIFAEYNQSDLTTLNSCTDNCDRYFPIYREDKDKEKIKDFHHPIYQGAVDRKISNLECKMKCTEPYRKREQEQDCYRSCGQELIKVVDGKNIRPSKKDLNACVMACTDKTDGGDLKKKLSQCEEALQFLKTSDSKVNNKLSRDVKEIENKFRECSKEHMNCAPVKTIGK